MIAHLRDRATLIHIGSPPCERPRPLRRRSLWIQAPFLREDPPVDSRPPHGEDQLPLVSSVVDFGSCIFLCIHGSSACVIILVGLSVLLCSPRDFPLVFPLVFLVFIMGSAPFVKDRATRVLPYIILDQSQLVS